MPETMRQRRSWTFKLSLLACLLSNIMHNQDWKSQTGCILELARLLVVMLYLEYQDDKQWSLSCNSSLLNCLLILSSNGDHMCLQTCENPWEPYILHFIWGQEYNVTIKPHSAYITALHCALQLVCRVDFIYSALQTQFT